MIEQCNAVLWMLLVFVSTLDIINATSCSEKEIMEVPIVGPGVQLGALFNSEKMDFTGREFFTRGGSDADFLTSDIEKHGTIKGSSGLLVRIGSVALLFHRLAQPLRCTVGKAKHWQGCK
jgi:hypothetical protein